MPADAGNTFQKGITMANPSKIKNGPKFNIFDILIILAVLVCVGAIIFRVFFISETQEDFVEIIAIYVTNTAEYWDELVGVASEEGQALINQKLALVKDYMLTTWGIDMDELRSIVQRRSQEVLTMDLSTLN